MLQDSGTDDDHSGGSSNHSDHESPAPVAATAAANANTTPPRQQQQQQAVSESDEATSDDADARLVLYDAIKADPMPEYGRIRERAARWQRKEVKAKSDATAEIARAAASSLLVPIDTLPPSKQGYALA